jgi:hypothetical protein
MRYLRIKADRQLIESKIRTVLLQKVPMTVEVSKITEIAKEVTSMLMGDKE